MSASRQNRAACCAVPIPHEILRRSDHPADVLATRAISATGGTASATQPYGCLYFHKAIREIDVLSKSAIEADGCHMNSSNIPFFRLSAIKQLAS